MLLTVSCEMGDGFTEQLTPLIKGHSVLSIAPKSRQAFLKHYWKDYDVQFATFHNINDFEQKDFDIVIIEDLRVRNSQQCLRVVEWLKKDQYKPIFFRPLPTAEALEDGIKLYALIYTATTLGSVEEKLYDHQKEMIKRANLATKMKMRFQS